MMIIAEVSDKIPTLAYYWIQAIGLILFGLLLVRFSGILGLVYSVLLLLVTVVSVSFYDPSDPFWSAVKREKGISYIVQSALSIGLSGLIVFLFALQKIKRSNNMENKALDSIGTGSAGSNRVS